MAEGDILIPGLQPASPFSVYRGGGSGDVSLGAAAPLPPRSTATGVDASRFMAPPEEDKPKRAAKATKRVDPAAVVAGEVSGGPGGFYTPEEMATFAEANRVLAAEEAQGPRGPVGFGEVAAGQALGSQEAYGDALGNWLRFAPRKGKEVNPLRPFAEQRVDERIDQDPAEAAREYETAFPFQPEPMQPLPRYEDESDEDYAARMQIFADADYRSQLDAYERQKQEWLATGGRDLTTLDSRDIGRAPGAIGMEEAQRQGQENVDAAKEAQDAELAREQAIAAGKQADATMAVVEQQERQRAEEEVGMAAVRQIQQTRDQARQALAAMPQRSREQIAKGMSLGTKVAAVLGAVAQGWRGDAVTAVNDAIDRAVSEEMDRYSRRQSEYQDVIAQADDAMGMMDFITNSLGGNREASAALLREMKVEDTIAELKAKEAATNVPVLKAQYQQMRVALEQQLRDESMNLEMQLAKTPAMIGYTIDTPFMKLMRREQEAAMKDARTEQMDIRKEYRGEAAKVEERAAELDVERIKAEGVVRAKQAESTAKAEQDIKMKSAAFGAVEQQIDDLLSNPGNIHGRGMVWTGDSDERITTDSQITALKQALTQAFTGATATPEQQEAFGRLVEGDWSELSDDALRARLRALKNIVSSQRRYLAKELGSSEKAINNPRELSTFQPR